MTIDEFQKLIEQLYYTKDKKRGLEGTFMWFLEEVGELSRAIRKTKSGKPQTKRELEEEFADCFAWLITLASLTGIRLETAIQKYKTGCPKCHKTPCKCKEK
ncbi:MAG: nucleotide pyrophosphohydrolase [candidate division WOR-3 bacterium]|nr:nucleotide pyrophosphohydrolase [candidate division WOR-3 bacterium]